jgi:hypothetical protein
LGSYFLKIYQKFERGKIMKNKQYWLNWLKFAGVRALKTVAQSAIGTIGGALALGGVDWRLVASAAVLAGVLSLLTSITGIPEVKVEETFEDEEKGDE